MKTVVLIDGKNMAYRHGMVNLHLSRSDGFPTGAIYGCLNSMLNIAKRIPDTAFVWVWDGDGETWRHKLIRENVLVQANFLANVEHNAKPVKHARKYGYKANRVASAIEASEAIEELARKKRHHKKHKSEVEYPTEPKPRVNIQIPVLRLILEGSGFRNFQISNLEGDDLIAILTRYLLRHTKYDVIIHSGDKDFYQLLKHSRVKILKNIQEGKLHFMDRKKVKKEYKVSVRDWVKYRAWTGDRTDNIKHLRNVGGSVAIKMLAAGLDPSLKYNDLMLPSNWEKLKRFFEPNGIERTWPFVEQNYVLCKFVSRAKDKRLPEKIREKVNGLLSDIEFTRDSKKINVESYRRVSHLLMNYEMRSILVQRALLWSLP
jgi:5'-3' exonuclease